MTTSKNLLGKFPTVYTNQILAYCKEKRPDILNKTIAIKDGAIVFQITCMIALFLQISNDY